MQIKFFSWLKESLGESIDITFEENITIKELKLLIIKEIGSKAEILLKEEILCAINQEFIEDENTLVKNNMEVAFFPPVTGG